MLTGCGLELEGRHDPEVAATTADGPKEIGMLGFADGHERAIGQHEIGGEQIVDRQAAIAAEIAESAAQREPTDAGGRDDAAGYRQPERLGGMIDIAPERAAFHQHPPGVGIDMHRVHAAQVDDDAVIAGAQSGGIVTAAAHADGQIVRAGEGHAQHHIGDIDALHDQGGMLVDHGVVDGTGRVISRIVRGDDRAAHRLRAVARSPRP